MKAGTSDESRYKRYKGCSPCISSPPPHPCLLHLHLATPLADGVLQSGIIYSPPPHSRIPFHGTVFKALGPKARPPNVRSYLDELVLVPRGCACTFGMRNGPPRRVAACGMNALAGSRYCGSCGPHSCDCGCDVCDAFSETETEDPRPKAPPPKAQPKRTQRVSFGKAPPPKAPPSKATPPFID